MICLFYCLFVFVPIRRQICLLSFEVEDTNIEFGSSHLLPHFNDRVLLCNPGCLWTWAPASVSHRYAPLLLAHFLSYILYPCYNVQGIKFVSNESISFYTIKARWEDNATVEHWRLPEEKKFSFVVKGGFCREVFVVAFYAKVHVFSMDDKGNSIRSSATAELFRCPLLVASSCEVSNRKCMVRVGLARSWGNPHLLEHLQA